MIKVSEVLKKEFFALSMVLSLESLFASPRGKQELVFSDSWVYDALNSITMEQGISTFADQAPLSIGEIQVYLSQVEYESLSPAGKKNYDRIMDYIANGPMSFTAGIISFGLDPEVNLEGYYKSNDDLDWVYDRYSKKPFINADAYFMAGDYFTLGTGIILSDNKCTFMHDDNYVNVPYLPGFFDINFPHYGYGSMGWFFNDTTGINLRLGLGPQSIGRTLTGSIIMSEYFTDSSWFNLEIFSPNIRYNMNVTEFNVDKYMYTHRFDVRFFNRLQITAMESMIVNAPMELRFFNPCTIFHGTVAWEDYDGHEQNVAAYLSLMLTYVPVKYLRLYVLYAMDQFQTAYERINWPEDTTPNALSFQLGAELYYPYKDGYFHGWLEGVYTDPFMYIKENPNWSFVRTYRENIGDMDSIYEWLGTPLGPDTVAANLTFGYEVPDVWSVTGSYLFKAAGQYSGTKVFDNYPELSWGGTDKDPDLHHWVYPDSDNEGGLDFAKEQQSWFAPSGTPEFQNTISIRGTYSPTRWLTLTLQPSFTFTFNHGNQEDSFACGGEIAFSSHLVLKRLFK